MPCRRVRECPCGPSAFNTCDSQKVTVGVKEIKANLGHRGDGSSIGGYIDQRKTLVEERAVNLAKKPEANAANAKRHKTVLKNRNSVSMIVVYMPDRGINV